MDADTNIAPNQVVCPECGRVRLETPPGTKVLPTLGMARKASGSAGQCGCGKHQLPVGPPEATTAEIGGAAGDVADRQSEDRGI